MIVYFFRHAIAGERDEWQGDDSERPLTKKGKKHTKTSAKTFAILGVQPDVIVTSPLVRAQQTADIAATELGLKDVLVEDERLAPGFNLEKLAQIIQDHPDVKSMMVVGHEPDFSSTVSALIGGGDIIIKKGGLARVDLEDTSPLKGQLVWLLQPKTLVDI